MRFCFFAKRNCYGKKKEAKFYCCNGRSVGGVVGENHKPDRWNVGQVSNCSNESTTVTSTGNVEKEYYYEPNDDTKDDLGRYTMSAAGGVIGISANGEAVDECKNTGTVNGYIGVGGIVGASQNEVSYCYSMGTVGGQEGIGGIVGAAMNSEYSKAEYSYYMVSDGEIDENAPEQKTKTQFESGEVAYLMRQDGGNWGQTISQDAAPVLNGATVYYDEFTDTYSNTITVHFIASAEGVSASNPASITNLNVDDTITAPTDPVCDRHFFLGWFIDQSYETEWDFSKGVTESMVLYAKWIETNLSLNGVYYDNLGAAVDAGKMVMKSWLCRIIRRWSRCGICALAKTGSA